MDLTPDRQLGQIDRVQRAVHEVHTSVEPAIPRSSIGLFAGPFATVGLFVSDSGTLRAIAVPVLIVSIYGILMGFSVDLRRNAKAGISGLARRRRRAGTRGGGGESLPATVGGVGIGVAIPTGWWWIPILMIPVSLALVAFSGHLWRRSFDGPPVSTAARGRGNGPMPPVLDNPIALQIAAALAIVDGADPAFLAGLLEVPSDAIDRVVSQFSDAGFVKVRPASKTLPTLATITKAGRAAFTDHVARLEGQHSHDGFAVMH